MLNGNLYGLIITILSLVIAIVLTMRHIEQRGIRVEFVIQPVREYSPRERPERASEKAQRNGDIQMASKQRVAQN
jgi:hypothetical protein